MIANVYITRVNNGDKVFGFGVTEDEKQVYIPGNIIENFDLSVDDLGTKNKMFLLEDRTGKTDFMATSILVEDSALQQAYEWQKDEIERLEKLLDDHGIEY